MSELLLLHAADLHLDSVFEALSENDAEARRAGQRRLLTTMAQLAEARAVHAVLLSGDVFDSDRVSNLTLDELRRSLGALSCPIIISPGNHDFYSPSSIWERAALPHNFHVFKSPNIQFLELPGIPARFWGAAFQSENCPALLMDFVPPEKQEGKADIMVIHGDFGSDKSEYNPITRQELEASGMDYVALGHIHSRSPLCYCGKTAYAWPGCTQGRGYDETGETGVYIVNISDLGVKADFVPLGDTRYHIIPLDISAADPLETIKAATKHLSKGDYCRLILRGECDELPNISLLRTELEGNFAELQIRDETRKKQDPWALAGQDSLGGVFTAKLKLAYDESLDGTERRKIRQAAQYGLSALFNGGERL